jgi:hypothetical protein
MYSNIGKKYWPVDNSYSICLDDFGTNYQLSGNHNNNPKQPEETKIVSEPYELMLWPNHYVPTDYTFINVICYRGLIHRVLFRERGFEPHTNDAMRDMMIYM